MRNINYQETQEEPPLRTGLTIRPLAPSLDQALFRRQSQIPRPARPAREVSRIRAALLLLGDGQRGQTWAQTPGYGSASQNLSLKSTHKLLTMPTKPW